jgi:crotonobetainyl-CoA:carnitine CoA-transferase CaiB-like acyl-CoA transferase
MVRPGIRAGKTGVGLGRRVRIGGGASRERGREHDVWQVMHVLQAQGVTAAVVEDLEDMCVRDPWLSTRHLASVPFEEAGIEYRTHNQPVRMNGELPALKRSPRFGEHSMQVLGTLLGLSASEIEELLIEEVVF